MAGRWAHGRKPEKIEIAWIEEDIRFTESGYAAIVVLLLSLAVSAFFYVGAKTVFQEISAGIGWVGSVVLWLGCAAMGRRRTYRIYRHAPSGDGG